MRHAVLERWSRGESPLHRRDPRAKTVALLVFLVAVATTHRSFVPLAPVYLALLLAAAASAGLPLPGAMARAAVVLPFSAVFAAICVLAGDPQRALLLAGKSYLSSLAVLVLVSTTPLPQLLRGLEAMGVPGFLLMVTQFLYRYLFVIAEEAGHMRTAALARGATLGGMAGRRARFRAAAGALAVLFSRSYARAENIHRAMEARGFRGRFRLPAALSFGWADATFLLIATLASATVRLAFEGHL